MKDQDHTPEDTRQSGDEQSSTIEFKAMILKDVWWAWENKMDELSRSLTKIQKNIKKNQMAEEYNSFEETNTPEGINNRLGDVEEKVKGTGR